MNRSERQKQHFKKHMEKQLMDPEFKMHFEEGLDMLLLGAKLAALREKHKLTQTQLAARIKSSAAVISRLESGKNAELLTVRKVAKALHAKIKFEVIPNERARAANTGEQNIA